MEKRTKKYKDFFKDAKKQLSHEQIKRANAKAQMDIFAIRLNELREMQGLTQMDIKGFTQSGISKLERRTDMKLSTLLEYLDSIGMQIEISVRSKSKSKKPISLLKNI